MMLMCSMAKPLWGPGKEVIMGSVIFVLKVLLLCLREGSMEVNWQKNNIYFCHQDYMDIESMPIVK